ncbi:spore coat assemly protein [Caldanaerobius fijiensis DSM 17918]|uniref:Spore coat assemly protein n=1 Tax=Caldanaerobius fijiensis DSM 17918 TaxID=1121256 RepID=A0A1M4Z5W6_9THEO|nr:sporulation peptidase YabG [Caldanaerobius fijiensis]SHF13197.1 spore coat assemly protein [Caldanaerobius fijiensis DSM 17918]
MKEFHIGDLVTRKSYNGDILFRICDILNVSGLKNYILRGVNVRIMADAPGDDLEPQPMTRMGELDEELSRQAEEMINKILRERESQQSARRRRRSRKKKCSDEFRGEEIFSKPGKVLHIDGDREYLNICLDTYRQLNVNVAGVNVEEKEQPVVVFDLLKTYTPDILVLTGHDGIIKHRNDYNDLNSYRNSRYFVEAVKKAREFEPSLDDLVIFAGACQSHYEALIQAGANYASSPKRVLIHALDPVFICEKIAYTSINDVVSPKDIISNTITGISGIGGLQTRGKYRNGIPNVNYKLKS